MRFWMNWDFFEGVDNWIFQGWLESLAWKRGMCAFPLPRKT